MSIENILTRLAEATERQAKAIEANTEVSLTLARLLQGQAAAASAPAEEKKAEPKQEKKAEPKQEKKAEPKQEKKAEPKPEPVEETPAADPLEEEEKPAAAPAKTYSVEDVRQALKEYRAIEGAEAMMEILRQNGANNLNELSPDKYGSVIAATK